MEPNYFGIIKGEQPLIRASRASKVAGAFLVLFWHAKENIPFYYRTVNLSKLFREAIDSAGKLAIMVLALRKTEC